MWLEAFATALQAQNLMYLLLGTAIGLVIGALPGLGPLFGVALMLPFTFSMPAATAIIFLVSIHAATAYGDSIASILINTPGGIGSVAACWDGYPLAKKGKAAMALGISTFGSLLGGIIGWITLVLIAPVLTAFAIQIGAPEYFMLGIMALLLLAVAGRGEHMRGLILGGVGLLLAFIGQDSIEGLNYRFTFGIEFLEDGLKLVPVTVGLFALSQAIVLSEQGGAIADVVEHIGGSVWEGVREVIRRPATVVRGGIVGILLGIMPALGISTANIIAYFVEKQASKEPETFGEGNPAGLLAPETSKSACVVGDLIPTFTLGIPGSATTAILMVALVIHNLEPGPRFFLSGVAPYTVFAGILLAQFAFFISGMFLARYFAKIVFVPNALLVPSIILLSFIGSYAMQNRMEDVIITVVFGLVGYFLHKAHWPTACLVLGMVLGDLIEGNFHRSLRIGDDTISIFFTRPISLVLFIITVLFLVLPYIVPPLVRIFRRHISIQPGQASGVE
jgi:putative tricarboxylic transport membrane protein